MQMQRIATVFAFVTVMAAIASADDEPASNQNDQQDELYEKAMATVDAE